MTKHKICRLCLARPSVYFSLLEENIADMVESLTAIKISEDDTFPTITCTKCLLNVKLAFHIQQNMIKCQERLQEIYDNESIMKTEMETDESEQENDMDLPEIEKVEITENNVEKIQENIENRLNKLTYSNCKICGSQVENVDLDNHIEEHYNHDQKCYHCGAVFNDLESYKTHYLNNHRIGWLHCSVCNIKIQYKCVYNSHVEKEHKNPIKETNEILDKENELFCQKCNKEFFDVFSLKKHHCYLYQKVTCNICNMEITKTNYNRHLLTHDEHQKCICEICGVVVRNRESLRGHTLYKHTTKIFKCTKCGETFRKKYDCELHKKRIHTWEKRHVCDTCGKCFSTFHDLNKHIKSIHLNIKPYTCDYCGKRFAGKYGMKSHVRQHTNENPYKCEMCGEGFKQNVSLRAHRKSKHNIIEPVTTNCDLCGKGFSSVHALSVHRRLH